MVLLIGEPYSSFKEAGKKENQELQLQVETIVIIRRQETREEAILVLEAFMER